MPPTVLCRPFPFEPAFVGEAIGLSNDDHPIADIRNGQAFLNSIYNAVRLGPKW